jgi:hypothetical protein
LPSIAVSRSWGLMGTDTERIVNLQPVVQHELPEPAPTTNEGIKAHSILKSDSIENIYAHWTSCGEICWEAWCLALITVWRAIAGVAP